MPKAWKERRKVIKEVYLDGRARYPHRQKPSLEKALGEEQTAGSSHSFSLLGVCPHVLQYFQDIRRLSWVLLPIPYSNLTFLLLPIVLFYSYHYACIVLLGEHLQ